MNLIFKLYVGNSGTAFCVMGRYESGSTSLVNRIRHYGYGLLGYLLLRVCRNAMKNY